MKREIFIVMATIVDANGTCSVLSGYPKAFDSRSYNTTEKAFNRACADFHETVGAMCKRDDRQLQCASVTRLSDNAVFESYISGAIADLPDPESQTTTE